MHPDNENGGGGGGAEPRRGGGRTAFLWSSVRVSMASLRRRQTSVAWSPAMSSPSGVGVGGGLATKPSGGGGE